MSKIAVYCRVGNSEQVEPTKEEQFAAMQRIAEKSNYIAIPNTKPIPSYQELKDMGYEVITLGNSK